jgi:hypothetical protein
MSFRTFDLRQDRGNETVLVVIIRSGPSQFTVSTLLRGQSTHFLLQVQIRVLPSDLAHEITQPSYPGRVRRCIRCKICGERSDQMPTGT